jgi:hypothetical protein
MQQHEWQRSISDAEQKLKQSHHYICGVTRHTDLLFLAERLMQVSQEAGEGHW